MATIKGIWLFNDTITMDGWAAGADALKEYVNFTSYKSDDEPTCNYIGFNLQHYTSSTGTRDNLQYLKTSTTADIAYVWEKHSTATYELGWQNEARRTVNFGSVEQDVSNEFYNWLIANMKPLKFTKLNIGDSVASSGGRVWKRASTVQEVQELTTPVISTMFDKLAITDTDGRATSFDVYVDGVFTATVAKESTNGSNVSVSNLAGTIWQFNNSVDFSQFTEDTVPYIYRTTKTTSKYIYIYAYEKTYDCSFYTTFSGYSGKYAGLGISTNGLHFVYGSGTGYGGKIYAANLGGAIIKFKSDITTNTTIGLDDTKLIEWFGANAKQIDAVFDLSTLDLSDGVHTITVKSQATGYAASNEANAYYNSTYVTDLTNTTWRISADSYKYAATGSYELRFAGAVSYGDYVLEHTAQRTTATTTYETTYFSNSDSSDSKTLYPRFRVSRSACQVVKSSSGSYVNIPYFDVRIDGGSTRSENSAAYITSAAVIRWFNVNGTLVS